MKEIWKVWNPASKDPKEEMFLAWGIID